MERINFEFGEVQAFLAVAEKLNFKAAADSVFVSQPALSRRINKLEAAVGTRLFERTTRRVSLTEAGQKFLKHAEAAMEALQLGTVGAAQSAARQSVHVTVGCVPSVAHHLLRRVLKSFAEEHPETQVLVLDESAPDVLAKVVSGVADFGLDFLGTQEPDIEFDAVCIERYVLAVRHGHPLARRDSVAWEELANEKWISVAKTSGNRILIDQGIGRLKKRPMAFYEATHVAGVLGMVEAGLGVAAVPGLSLSEGAHPDLVGVPLVEPAILRTLGLITKKGKRLAPPAEALYELLKRSIATRVGTADRMA